MKFIINAVSKEGCRHGIIKELGCHGNLGIETPACLLYTRAGAVPHLTWDLVEMMRHRPQCVQLTCSTLVDQLESLTSYGKGVAQFASIPERGVTFSSVQDPAHPTPTGYNDKRSVSVFTPAGRTKFDVGLFMALQEAIQPDWFEALCDGDTAPGCSVKRTQKAVDRTLTMLDECMEMKQKSQKLQHSDVLGVIEGGEVSSERERSARETALRPVAGFVLDAFSERHMDQNTRRELIETVLKELPEAKPRLLPGVGSPDHVIQAVEAGIDIFDSAYPYAVTQRGCALVFPHELACKTPDDLTKDTLHPPNHPLRRGRTPEAPLSEERMQENGESDTRFELDLSDKRFAEDFGPVVPGCDCYCCSNHTRAYINHLLTVNELLAKVLLMNHNCQHYFQFFHAIRTSLKEGSFHELKETINSER